MDEPVTLGIDGRDRAGTPDVLSLRVFGQGVFMTVRLPASGSVVIGRSKSADVPLEDPSISRSHARLHIGPPLEIEDLGSANGTRVRERNLGKGERVPVEPGEVIDLGSVMAVVQRSAGQRPRRIWSHGYFEGRLEEECARSERTGATFAMVRVHAEPGANETILREVFVEALRPADVVAAYAPGEHELLLLDLGPEEARAAVDTLVERLEACDVPVRAGLACYPRDGRTAESLVALACAAVRRPARPSRAGGAAVALDPSVSMSGLHRLVERIAAGNISVLLLGETGTGKEVMAENIHRLSPRRDRPLLRLNCAALSESLLESELFGHEKGAFTGADRAKPGLLETADGGTVFLDEIGELPMNLQVKLLRVLEERKATRVGALKPRSIDVRFISATNRDLEREIDRGAFRQDLYYRLNGVSLVIPALRDRVNEIEPLARSFVAQFSRESGRPRPPELSPAAVESLRRYSWPGNIRELRNVMERALLLCAGAQIEPEHLPLDKMGPMLQPAARAVPPPRPAVPAPEPPQPPRSDSGALRSEIEQVERRRILDALQQCAGNQTRAAKLLGISRNTLLARMEAYRLPRPRRRTRSGT